MKFFDELKWRGLVKDVSSEELEKKLNDETISFYWGTDPTADSLHLGHYSSLVTAKRLAKLTGAVVSISGATDYITDGETVNTVPIGSPMMTKVTGLGCSASAITGAFAAVNKDYLEAATNAMFIMGLAGHSAAAKSNGPGSLQLNFLDELYNATDNYFSLCIKYFFYYVKVL